MSALRRLALVALLPALAAADPLPPGAVARLGTARLRHADRPSAVVFSPDGKTVISGGLDGLVCAWDVATGSLQATLRKPETWVVSLKFTHGGTRLAGTFGDNRVRFLRPDTLAESQEIESANATWLALSADGTLAAVLSAEGTIQVIEVVNGVPKLELPPSARFPAFSPDGKSVASSDEAGTVTVSRVTGGKPLHTVRHGEKLESIVFAPDGSRLVTLGTKLKVWTLGDEKPPIELDARGPIGFMGTDRLAAVRGTAVGIWDFGKATWVHEVRGVTGAFAISPDGTKLAATGSGLRVRLWDVPTGKELHGAGDSFPDAALLTPSPDGKELFVAAGVGGFRWSIDANPATPAATFPGAATAAVIAGKRLAVATDGGIAVWDDFDPTRPRPANPDRTVRVPGVKLMATSADGKHLACTGDDRVVRLIDPAAGRLFATLPIETGVLAVAFTPDGKTLLTHGRDGRLRAWGATDPPTERWTARVQRGPWGAVAVSPDGKLVAASSAVRLVVLNPVDGKEVFAIDRDEDDGPIRAVAFSPDGRLLFIGSHGPTGCVKVWEVATRTRVRKFTTGMGGVTRMSVFPDGRRVASAGADETITVWDLAPRDRPPTDDELTAAWAALDSRSAAMGVPAVLTLEAGGNRGVKAIRSGLVELSADRKRVVGWVRELDADDFAAREEASRTLLKHGHRALPALLHAANRSESPEVRRRAKDVIDKLAAQNVRAPGDGFSGDGVRLVRAVAALEKLGGADAVACVTEITEFGGRVGDEATAALARMRR